MKRQFVGVVKKIIKVQEVPEKNNITLDLDGIMEIQCTTDQDVSELKLKDRIFIEGDSKNNATI